MKAPPHRVFESKFDKILRISPPLGKVLAGLFGLFEYYILEISRKIDKKFNTYTMGLVSKYFLKGRWGGRVVPLNKNINTETKFIPSQEILEILYRSNIAGIGWCYCRITQRKYGNPNCDHPIHACIHLGYARSLYDIPFKSYNLKKVSKQEIKDLLEDCDNRGLIHQLIYFPNPQFYYVICNCCPCCCVVLNKFLKSGSPQMIKSDFIAETDHKRCKSCGTCEEICYFKARTMNEGLLHFNQNRCFGCGICVPKCPNHAIYLIKKP
ncbi:MAG: 4Fe-4S binding protein [Promethearchaeota archaeon]